MNSLMKQRYRDGTALRDHEIAHIMIALLMAGQHTSSSSLAWVILHIAARPDIQYVVMTLRTCAFRSQASLYQGCSLQGAGPALRQPRRQHARHYV